LPVEGLYTAENLRGSQAARHPGFPGEFPFTRGIYPTMYLSGGRPCVAAGYVLRPNPTNATNVY
jgi:methylmalonyl-CoA mutase N-terminal domain/subunit